MKISQRALVTRPFWLIPLAVGLMVLVLPFLGIGAGILQVVISVALLALLVLGLNMTFGYGGELALGQSAIYGVGAYFAGYLATQKFDLSIGLLAAILAAAVIGLITAIPGIRLGAWSLAMVTLFLVLLFPNFVTLLPEFTGGQAGLSGIPLPVLFGVKLSATGFYVLVIGVTVLTFALFRNFVASRHGVALKVMRESPVLARSLGISVPRLKLTAYVLSALPAGVAGALFASQQGYLSHGSFGFQALIPIIAASVIGGSASIYGALIGAAIMVIGPLSTVGLQEYSLIFFGGLLLIAGLFFTGGLTSVANKFILAKFVDHRALAPDVEEVLRNPSALEHIDGKDMIASAITMDFGGNRALDGVNLETKPGQITVLIGPNGSGKTTLLNVISGFYRPTSGVVSIEGDAMEGKSAHRLAMAGVSRTFQTPVVPREMTAVDVVASARFSRSRTSIVATMLRMPSARRGQVNDRAEALRLLSLLGIAELADRPASDLPLGTRRLLEVARALAGDPAVVLLDEPASGLDENEVEALGDLIRALRDAGANIVIVEHNFEMIMGIADQVNVLHLGKIIASGPPSVVRDDPAVIESYLGKAARDLMTAGKEGAAS
ncbi:ABC transporter permease subunit [Arthrobacter sp. AZCC_0090]|uniref:branched-chain amino acid ABC transporter ATP-binding protein/permease n=1 Tax=Arthrobacter sp. AZCC_0090 TaxID=2735881 RepID=UPI001616D7BD|nr:branched-chain amino acid ABC transporter ATP-binding protein/permease [Arthrobacter sp. AZCC_0090]MBB6407196.1 branched-chain amino acid transport system permease protein [Arthrobacter sp. AZCC_0090]